MPRAGGGPGAAAGRTASWPLPDRSGKAGRGRGLRHAERGMSGGVGRGKEGEKERAGGHRNTGNGGRWPRATMQALNKSPLSGIPEGTNTLASGSYNSTVIIWDVATGEQKAQLKGHTREVTSVAWGPERAIENLPHSLSVSIALYQAASLSISQHRPLSVSLALCQSASLYLSQHRSLSLHRPARRSDRMGHVPPGLHPAPPSLVYFPLCLFSQCSAR